MKLKKFLEAGAIGIITGLLISIVFSALSSSQSYTPLNAHSPVGQWLSDQGVPGAFIMLYALLIWFLLGLLFGISSQFFERNWSPLKATLAHYLTSLFGFLPLAFLAGWIDPVSPLSFILSITLQFSAIYLILWIIFYMVTRKKIKEINHILGQ
ncbi:DUF3021 domain-containing protein [Streptococcus oricebi]|uniref:DUF3021 domain-containing protein n=1 Tax=Streptococcus oricebi TaxID=1547447 RepID=A0ABS5B501_9STRE|nr:DUF3021 domain-containing protein [Streptococcus oricebi]MBP2623923.1 DUF3021 domain-containing protein [Streptococcus oricebi]